jgi:S-adenosylmethionine synthetase
VETFGTGRIPDDEIARIIERVFEFRLAGIVRQFNLRYLPSLIKGGFFRRLAAYGHVGRMDIGLPWEVTDKISEIKV